jgi:hypothetical protein
VFEGEAEASGAAVADPLDARAVAAWLPRLARFRDDVSDAERVDQLRALEQLKAAAAAAQARIAVDLDESHRAAHKASGLPRSQRGRGVAGQVAFARRESPFLGARHLGLAKVLVAEMPHTLAAFERGLISEWRAILFARETACLSLQHRQEIDARLAGDPSVLEGLGDRHLVAEIRRLAYELDPESVVRRRARAESERRVTCRPAPDSMSQLSALLPVAQGVAVYATLLREADSRVATGDGRTRGQIMADTLVERVTGQATATAVPVEIHLVMTDRALLGCGDGDSDVGSASDGGDPGYLFGFGPVPADLARRLAVSAAEAEAAWLRRLYTAPATGELIGMDSRRRLFPPGLARFIQIRDQVCRTPWCGALIRHTDHVVPHHEYGPTSAANGQGLCEQCNYNRQAPGWRARPRAGPRHTVVTTTPTGHTYITTAPHPPGSPPRTRRRAPRRRATTTETGRARGRGAGARRRPRGGSGSSIVEGDT